MRNNLAIELVFIAGVAVGIDAVLFEHDLRIFHVGRALIQMVGFVLGTHL